LTGVEPKKDVEAGERIRDLDWPSRQLRDWPSGQLRLWRGLGGSLPLVAHVWVLRVTRQDATLQAGETVEIGVEDIALQDEVGELALPFDADETGGCEFLHVVGEGGGADGLRFRDAGTGRGAVATADLGEDFIAARRRERTGDEGELPVGEADLLCGAGAFFGHGFLP
jgi:hypothetical protein